MKAHGLMVGALAVTWGMMMSGIAAADNCNGSYHNVGQVVDTQDLGNGVTLTSFTALSSNFYTESGEMRAGSCSGYVLSAPGNKFRVVYACARKNKAGDVAVDEGSLEPGAAKGTWKVTTATGSLTKSIGDAGWWQGVVEYGKVSAGIWGGNCK